MHPGAGEITVHEVTYGYSYSRPALEGINLRIESGAFVGILGPSGSGKTTLLKLIAGLIKPWDGSVRLTGRPEIGYVPQVESVDWTFPVTAREVVSMGAWNRSGRGPWISRDSGEKIGDLLESLGIGEYAFRQISELSGGEQQRVFLARAMIRSPEILVLDEPTSGVDHATREAILGVLADLNRKGTTVILTTHDISGVARRIPWVVCMNRRIISEGRPQDMLTNENLLATYGLMDTGDA